MRYTTRRNVVKSIVAGSAAVGLAGCNSQPGSDGDSSPTNEETNQSDDSSGDQGEITTIRFAGSQTGASGLILRTLIDQGFDVDNNISMRPTYMGPTEATQALVNGQVDATSLPQTTAAGLVNGGDDVALIRPFYRIHEGAYVPEDSDVSSMEGLQDITLGSLSESSSMWALFTILANLRGLNTDDFDIRTSSPQTLYGLLLQGDLDGTLHFDPYRSRLMARGYKEVFYFNTVFNEEIGNSVPASEIGVQTSLVEDSPDVVRNLNAAFQETATYIRDNAESVFQTYQGALGIENEDALQIFTDTNSDLYPVELNEDGFRDGSIRSVELAAEYGVIDEVPDTDQLFVDPTSL